MGTGSDCNSVGDGSLADETSQEFLWGQEISLNNIPFVKFFWESAFTEWLIIVWIIEVDLEWMTIEILK